MASQDRVQPGSFRLPFSVGLLNFAPVLALLAAGDG